MLVFGQHSRILARTGKTVDVQAFSPDIAPLELELVDAAVLYENPYTGKLIICIAQNALYVPTMNHNLVPPFILREAGVEVNEVPKFHVKNPNEEHHSLYWEDADVRIPMSLHGTFSYFPTRKPTDNELSDAANAVVLLTPTGPWNPNSEVFAENEDNMVDHQGNVIVPSQRPKRILLQDVEPDATFDTSLEVSTVEASAIDQVASCRPTIGRPDLGEPPPFVLDEDRHSSAACFAAAVLAHDEISEFHAAIGATVGFDGDVLFPEFEGETILPVGQLDMDDIMVKDVHATNSRGVNAETLSKIWRIDLETAQRTIDVTSQRCVRSEGASLSRNYSTNDRMLRYRRIDQHFFMDTFFATSKKGQSTRGNTCCQLFVTDKGFVYVVPMKSKSQVPQALKAFAKAVGAPDAIICDAAREQISKAVRQFLQRIGTTLRVLEKNTPWANRAELYIGLIKESVRKDMKVADSPLSLWDYCVERRARINNLTAGNLFQLEGRNPHHTIYGQEGDISNLCQFEWYQWVYFREEREGFPGNKQQLGRCLGPATGEGNEMAQWILKHNGKVVPRRSLRPLTSDEAFSETEINKRNQFDKLIKEKLGDSMSPMPVKNVDPFLELYEDDDEEPFAIPEVDDPVDYKGKPLNQQPVYDQLINAELMLPNDGEYEPVQVVGRATGPDGKVHGNYHENPVQNTIMYDVRFPDGQVKEYAANVIAENLLSQVDDDGFTVTRVDCILDHKKDSSALPDTEMYTTNEQGVQRIRKTTRGWQLLVRWHDGSTQWINLSILKESNPVEVATYAKSRGIDTEPAFAWWVPYTLKKKSAIISAIKTRTRKTTHKYGIEVPRSVEHSKQLDAKNKNDYWAKALSKEMRNVSVAFDILEPTKRVPPGWTKVTGHIIFDVKMTLERKARWVLDGHLTAAVDYSTYAGVVSRESVRIALTYAALNDLDVWAADIQNAYIQAPSSRKDYITCGPEFGLENVGKAALIRRAQYGGKSAGRDFRNHLRSCMDHLGFKSCRADPDVWMRPATKKDGSQYWEYVLLYVDDCLVISEKGESVLRNEIGKYFTLKQNSIGPPDIYLGGKMSKVRLENGLYAWAFGSSQYIQAAVKNVEDYLRRMNLPALPKKADLPITRDYRPEIDISLELTPNDASHFQSLIGVLRWIVELGRVDIAVEVSMLSSCLALPRRGHLQQVYHIFAYLKKHHNAEMVFDPTRPEIDMSLFERKDWSTSEMDMETKEELPPNMPEPRGIGFVMRAYVDADHAADSMTRKSRTGFLVFLNNAPIYWMSKKQTSVETSSFGSEFIAMKLCTEYVRGLRYKLRMLGISCEEPTYVYGDNKSVLCNTTIPESTLKKKSHSIAYHFVREGVARDEWRTAYVNTHLNPSDMLTKSISAGEKRKFLVRMLLHHIYG